MRKWAIAAALAVIASIVWFFQAHTPLLADNYVFSRQISPGFGAFYAGAPLDSIKEMTLAGAFQQSLDMYFTWCGRFMGNLAVYMLFLLPRPLYAFLSGILFSIYILLLYVCIQGREWRKNLSPGPVFALAGMVWLGMPSFGEAFLWLSVGGEIALIAQALVLLPYRMALEGGTNSCGPHRLTAALAFAVFCTMAASLDYATSAALPPTAILCVAWLYLKAHPRKVPLLPACGAIGLAIGAWLTLAAPGNACRLLLSRDPNVHEYMAAGWLERISNWIVHLPDAMLMQWLPLLLLIWGCFLLYRMHGRRWPAFIPAAAWLFVLPALLTHASYLFTAWPPPRAFATTFSQLLICAGIVFVAARGPGQPLCRIAIKALAILCIASVLLEGAKFISLCRIADERENILLASKEMSVTLPPMPQGSGDRYWVLGKYVNDIGPDPEYWVNRAMAAHYGAKQVKICMPVRNFAASGVDATIEKGKIKVLAERPAGAGKLYFYYFGGPALLNSIPGFLAEKIFSWLANDKNPGWKRYLIPIFLARADVAMHGDNPDRLAGESSPLNFSSPEHLWLVKPGEKEFSLDVEKMQKI